MNPQDLFGMMGGGMFPGMGGGMQRRQRKGRDVGVRFPVKLETLYCGGEDEVPLPRTELCKPCKGTGAKNAKSFECGACRGQGFRLQRRALGPGMIQQMQVACDQCQGEGTTIKDADKCTKCNGRKVQEVDRKLKFKVTPGMGDGEQIRFERAGDEHPELDIPGDVIIVLQAEPHDRFERQDEDLVITQKVTLAEALLGFSFELEHLDGRKLLVTAPKGTVITPEKKMTVKGEGMPKQDGRGKGDLVVVFELEFPKMLAEDQVDLLKKHLPKGRKVDQDFEETPEECFMDSYTPEEWKSMGAVGEDEEEDAEEDGGPGIQCAHQ